MECVVEATTQSMEAIVGRGLTFSCLYNDIQGKDLIG
ncbi:hypothetical protein AX13_15815 [Comamonas aquatica DA1877]|uniref:Uncharacterized protein n=1 Tax=Comamonas aquatica DA1877 TaxID=1457173 RepID=A0A014NMR0_9BURK|nr:hypothetical protein AX13_15815 [Comamonas aquatica DA1877]